MNMPTDMFDDLINQPAQNVPLDFLPEMVGHSDPSYLVEELEQENIELFGVNLVGRQIDEPNPPGTGRAAKERYLEQVEKARLISQQVA